MKIYYGVVYPSMLGVSISEHETLDEAKKKAKEICSNISRQVDVVEFITSFVPCSQEVERKKVVKKNKK